MMRTRFAASVLLFALVAAPGLAFADGIEISGTAEMGLAGHTESGDGARLRLLSDLDIQIRMSRTTDSGLTIAVEVDLDDLDLGDTPHDPQFPRRR